MMDDYSILFVDNLSPSVRRGGESKEGAGNAPSEKEQLEV
jgi:hypothetical protein